LQCLAKTFVCNIFLRKLDCKETMRPGNKIRKMTFEEYNQMSMYRTKGFNRLTEGGNNYKLDSLAMKYNPAQGAPVVIEMMVGGSFMSNMMGQAVWRPSQNNYSMQADELTKTDYMAVVISSSPIDYNVMNKAINSAPGASYRAIVNSSNQVNGVNFTSEQTIGFNGKLEANSIVYVVMQIDKD
jgi:hypothetical protein